MEIDWHVESSKKRKEEWFLTFYFYLWDGKRTEWVLHMWNLRLTVRHLSIFIQKFYLRLASVYNPFNLSGMKQVDCVLVTQFSESSKKEQSFTQQISWNSIIPSNKYQALIKVLRAGAARLRKSAQQGWSLHCVQTTCTTNEEPWKAASCRLYTSGTTWHDVELFLRGK
jgi:hypothetical protein